LTEQAQANTRERVNGLRSALYKDSAGQDSTAWRDGGGEEWSKFNLQRSDKVYNRCAASTASGSVSTPQP
jgi:hypothetical protein